MNTNTILTATKIDDIFRYVTNQTNKVAPIVAQAGPNKVNLTDQLVESFVSDIILFLFEILGPTRTSEFRKRHFDSPEYGRNGLNSDDESHYGGFQKT